MDETIGKVKDRVRSDETVQYIARGNSVDAKYQGSTTEYNNTKGWPRLVVTDQRVFFKVPKVFDTKVESVDYDNLTAIDRGSSGLSGTEIKLRTVRGRTYVFRADKPGKAELEEMIDFIRGRISDQQTPSRTAAESAGPPSETTTRSASPTEADLHKAESCIECGEGVSGGISRCPHCGYNPSDHNTWFYIHALLAGIAGFTIIGLLIVPVFWWKGRKHRKKYKRGVTG